MNNIVRKNVVWNAIGALTGAFNSLFFAIIVTRINGVNDAGIFTYGFATACLLYIVAVYLGRPFQVTDLSKENSDTDYIYNRIFTCIIMFITSISFCLIKGYNIDKSLVLISLCGFKVIEAFSDSIYAIIQKNEQLYKVGISMFLKAIIGLIVFLVIDIITKNMIFACISLIVVNITILIFYDIVNMKKVNFVKTKYTNLANLRLLKIGFNTFLLNFLAMYLINAQRYAIDDLLTNNLQTIFGIIIMPATFMGLLGQYIIQPILTSISKNIKEKEYKPLKNIITRLLLIIAIIGVLVFIVAYLLELPVLNLVYGLELQEYKLSMMIIIIGSIAYSYSIVLSTILISMRKTSMQVILYFICSLVTTILSYSIIKKIEILGASITYIITMFLIAILLLIYTIYNMKKYNKEWNKK